MTDALAQNHRLLKRATHASVAVALMLIAVKFGAYLLTGSVSLLSTLLDNAWNAGRDLDLNALIQDIQLALTDGYTSGNGLGLGFGGARRLVGEFEVRSTSADGTVVRVATWR